MTLQDDGAPAGTQPLTTPTVRVSATGPGCNSVVAHLLQRAAGGDEAAYAALYDLTSARVYGVARRVLRNPAQAEEVAQEVYLEIWRTGSRFVPERGSALSWILVIAHRRAVDRVRSEESRVAREDNEHRMTRTNPPGGNDPTGDLASANDEASRVRRAIAELTPIQRVTLELTYFGGYTNAQVAHLTQAPISTTKSRLRSALVRLGESIPGR